MNASHPMLSIRTPARHYIGGAFRAPAAGAELPVIDPSDGKPFASIARGDAPDVDAAVRAARAAFDGALGQARAGREGAPADGAFAGDPRPRRRARVDRGARLRQADEAGARGRSRLRALLRVLRGRARQAARRHDSVHAGLHGADLARAAGRHGTHHPVELPDADLRAQRRRGARGGQRVRRQAGRGCVPVAAAHRRARERVGAARRHAQRRHRAGSRGGDRARAASGDRPPVVHRVARDRHIGRAGSGEAPLPGHARAGRQGSADRVRRRRPRRGDSRDRQRDRAERRARPARRAAACWSSVRATRSCSNGSPRRSARSGSAPPSTTSIADR